MNQKTLKDSTADAEVEGLVDTFGDRREVIIGVLERQLNALHLRGQVVIGFGAVVVTTTGFSGRLIAGTNDLAQVAIIAGLLIVLAGCYWIFLKVMKVHWIISRSLKGDWKQSLLTIIQCRDRKTRALHLGSYGVLVGLGVYALAIAIMLLNPEPLSVPIR